MKLRTVLIEHPKNRPFLRNAEKYEIKELRALVLHWTANRAPSATAINNRSYYNNGTSYASAHFNVDDSEIVQCLPLSEVGFHVGARRYTEFGEELREGYPSPNYTCIGVEMCVNTGADFEQTYLNTVQLFAELCMLTGLYVDKITTHHAITGKHCPQLPDANGDFHLITDEQLAQFKKDVERAYWPKEDVRDIVL